MAARFSVDPRSGVPLYLQLIEQIKRAVALGTLAAGEQLPTVKALAVDLIINPNTVARAYRELERDRVIETSPGRGSFVRAGTGAEEAQRAGVDVAAGVISEAVREARALGIDAATQKTLFEPCARALVSYRRKGLDVNAIAIAHLAKTYGTQRAVDDLSLAVPEGSVCGLLGPNGSGKSTTFKCLLALARPTSGTAEVLGAPVTPATFESLGYVPETSALLPKYSVGEHLEATRRAFTTFDPARAAELAAIFKLDRKKRIGKLSKGQRTALAIVLAFSIRPRVLVLDEPASGLDPMFQRAVLDLIIDAAAGGASILFSSHQIGQVERAADTIAVLRGGRLVLHGDIDTLKGDRKVVEAIFPGDAPPADALLRDPRVSRIERNGRILRVHVGSDADEIVRTLEALAPRTIDVFDLSLEDIFLGAVSGDAAGTTERDGAA